MSSVVRRAVALAAVTALSAVLLPLAGLPAVAVSTPPSPRTADGATLVGAFVTRGDAATMDAAASAFESQIGRRLDVQRWFARWDEDVSTGSVPAAAARGRVVMLSFEPTRLDGTRITWAAIARGDGDAQIVAQAAAVKKLGVTVYLTLHHEPEMASTAFGTAADYRAAWRHYVAVFGSHGATSVLWTWITTRTPFVTGTDAVPAFYPGDDVVDRVGLDAYNWAGCAPGVSGTWRPLGDVVSGFRAFALAHAKRAVLPEFGSPADPSDPGRQGAWLKDAFSMFAGWPQLEAVSYYDRVGTCDWRLSAGSTSQQAFAAAASAPAAHGRPAAWLVTSKPEIAAGAGESFDLSASTGAACANGTGIASWTVDFGDGSPIVTGAGQPASAVLHTYAIGGSFTPRLTVADRAGARATDTGAAVRVFAPPLITGSSAKDLHASSATLLVWVNTDGIAGQVQLVQVAGGRTVGSTTLSLRAVDWPQQVRVPITGLSASTTYTWTTTATTAAGTATLTRTFATTR